MSAASRLLLAPAITLSGASLTAACLLGYVLITLRGRRLPLPPRLPERRAGVLLLSSLLGAHLGGLLSEHGLSVFRTPALLVSSTSPLHSAGGFLAAALALSISLRAWRLDAPDCLRLLDLVAFAFPFAWAVARAGCAIAHDHPGRLSSSPLAVSFPDGARLDCGLLELLATPALLLLAVALSRRRGPPPASRDTASGRGPTPGDRPGLLAGSMALAYSLIRFPLDFLRATDLPGSDPRYSGLTAAQWGAIAVFPTSVAWLVWWSRGAPERAE